MIETDPVNTFVIYLCASVKTIGGLGRGKTKVNAGHCATEGDQSIASGWHRLEPPSPPAPSFNFLSDF